MLIPVSCDALLYHLPIATVSLIVVNVAVFIAMAMGFVNPLNGWVLMYGEGLKPLQWLLSIFTHSDVVHLLGNMFFLWTFGLVTEGKLGWSRFLATYLLIGVGQSAIEQMVMLHAQPGPGSVGASAAIFGLMAMACVWAPLNEVKMFCAIGVFYFFSFEISVVILSAIYIGMEVGWAILVGALGGGSLFALQAFAWSSILHSSGALMGGILGVVLLKRKLVDCDQWDLFAVLRGKQGETPREELAPPSEEKIAAYQQQKTHDLKQKLLAYLKIGQAPQALQVFRKARDLKLPLELSRQEQLQLITGLDQHKLWADSAPLMVEFVNEFPDNCVAVKLRLAQICLVELNRPAKTLELLIELKSAELNENQSQLRKKLKAVAEKQIAEGEVELDEAI